MPAESRGLLYRQSPPLTSALYQLSFLATFAKLKCGLVSGLGQAGLFNPWDRALYLSIKHNRPFLSYSNFQHPFQGLMQTITQRAISSGLYFPLEEIFHDLFKSNLETKDTSPAGRMWLAFLSGTAAGAVNGLVMNPVTAVKVSSSRIDIRELMDG